MIQAFYDLLVRDILTSPNFKPELTEKDYKSSFIENRRDVLEISQMFKNKSNFFSCYLFVTWLETILSLALLYYLCYVGLPIVLAVSIWTLWWISKLKFLWIPFSNWENDWYLITISYRKQTSIAMCTAYHMNVEDIRSTFTSSYWLLSSFWFLRMLFVRFLPFSGYGHL